MGLGTVLELTAGKHRMRMTNVANGLAAGFLLLPAQCRCLGVHRGVRRLLSVLNYMLTSIRARLPAQ